MTEILSERIMIVSRDLNTSYLLQRFVRTSARPVIAAMHSDDVLSLARCEKPVAIVLEVDTPETAGWHMLKILKSDPETGRIPVMICSWLDDAASRLADEADVYLRMPILYEEFAGALTTLLIRDKDDPTL
jgi:response regulator RpfG family c-di-GMP phosphodiesterase